jgi:very-short-patch-repair endonuclease
MRPKVRQADAVIARIAGGQHGLVTTEQLVRAGISPSQIRQRVRRGSLYRVHRGVYLVGHRGLTVDARYLAAVLACGEGSVLAGRAGGFHSQLLRGDPPRPEVLTLTDKRVPGVITRRYRGKAPLRSWRLRGIPVLRPPALLVDLARSLNPSELARACHESGVRYRTTPAQVAAVLQEKPNAVGAGALRRVVSGEEKVTLSALEARFKRLLKSAGLPIPDMNRRAGSKRVDCRWPAHRVTVELDSYTFHNSRHSWEQDRRREREAIARGDRFRRYTYDDVVDDGSTVIGELTPLLSRRSPD